MILFSGLSFSSTEGGRVRRAAMRCAVAASCLLVAGAVFPRAALAHERTMDLKTSLAFIERAKQAADAIHAHVAIAIVDEGGNLVALEKMDGTQLGSMKLAIMKAKTSVNYARPSADMEHALNGGNYMIGTLPDTLPAGGGYPITIGNRMIGALGLSGGEGETDANLAKEAVTTALQALK
ncbi:GlcG/HbpS family heme-binding protein [Gluconacetobacter aggeris]|nr:heme-binding protein [Gluconacetobacter aggeris]